MLKQRSVGFLRLDVGITLFVAAMAVLTFFPRFRVSPEQQKQATAEFDLARLRCVVQSYRAEHGGLLPKLGSERGYLECLCQRTAADGRTSATGNCGPYLAQLPENPFTGSREFRLTDRTQLTPGEITPDNRGGWLYNERTGQVWLDSEPGWKL